MTVSKNTSYKKVPVIEQKGIWGRTEVLWALLLYNKKYYSSPRFLHYL